MIREPIWKAVWRVNRIIPLGLVGLIVVNVLLFAFLTYRLEVQASTIQTEFIRLQAEERRTQSGREDSESPVVIYTRGVADLQKFRQAIPAKSELSGLVAELFSLASHAGLKINSVQYDSTTDQEHELLHYKINYQVTGTYKQIKKMVHMIEQSGRLITIDKLSLDSAKKGKSVSLSLTLETFFRTDQV